MKQVKTIAAIFGLLITLSACSTDQSDTKGLEAKIAELQAQVDAHSAERAQTKRHLELFDEMDLNAFNSHDLDRIGEIHHKDVEVFMGMMPVDQRTKGYAPDHVAELHFLWDQFDMKIPEHTIGFGYGEWTAGVSITTGRFAKPITTPDGKVHQPNDKTFEIQVATLAKWKDEQIVEEYIYWDQDAIYRQLGIYE